MDYVVYILLLENYHVGEKSIKSTQCFQLVQPAHAHTAHSIQP